MASGTCFKSVRQSLTDLLGGDYVRAAAAARSRLVGQSERALLQLAEKKVDFFPVRMQHRLAEFLPRVGRRISPPARSSPAGAASAAFAAATRTNWSPLTGWGYYRVGEDGRLRFLSKSEHYHASLGHSFPGYRLVELASRLGLPNATHNNTRGHITRLVEEELVRTANGLERGDRRGLANVLAGRNGGGLNRVLNLETGSLAAEAGLKLMLARFHRPQADSAAPAYAGRRPVIVVVGDDHGGLSANYHGTTIIAQVLRGMWPSLAHKLDKHGLVTVAAVRPNHLEDLQEAFVRYDRRPFKIAGYISELVLMNYGGRRLSPAFVRLADELCRRHDAPMLIDEIQSCLWSPRLYLFREYGIRPDMVVIGKGFPGGQYSASRILFSERLDCLPQFGALVTNGQEELASLAYLVTMRWAEENAELTAAIGQEYQCRLEDLARRFPDRLAGVDGWRHMTSLRFHDLAQAKAFVKRLSDGGLDVSVQSYKSACPPVVLTKLPLIAGRQAVDMVATRMESAMRRA